MAAKHDMLACICIACESLRQDAARYRFLRDDGHLEYMGPDSNKKLPARAIDKVVDRWMRMQGKATAHSGEVKP
jgi:hypothetical protein